MSFGIYLCNNSMDQFLFVTFDKSVKLQIIVCATNISVFYSLNKNVSTGIQYKN